MSRLANIWEITYFATVRINKHLSLLQPLCFCRSLQEASVVIFVLVFVAHRHLMRMFSWWLGISLSVWKLGKGLLRTSECLGLSFHSQQKEPVVRKKPNSQYSGIFDFWINLWMWFIFFYLYMWTHNNDKYLDFGVLCWSKGSWEKNRNTIYLLKNSAIFKYCEIT